MATFPQINSNMIITQLPYDSGSSFETVQQEVESGMRWSFPRRGSSIPGYPTKALGKFNLNYPSITDAEVTVLYTFFESMKGRRGYFRLLDPGGNLLQYSEDFSQAYWDKSNGPVTVGSTGVTDPFGGTLATTLVGSGSNAFIMGVAGPSDGGINGYRLSASCWAKSPVAAQLRVGLVDSGFSQSRTTLWNLPAGRWVRISHSETTWDTNYFRMIIGGNSTWSSGHSVSLFGAQVSSMKGEGAYTRSPDNWGYRSKCRFDTDKFTVTSLGPNQNSLSLPVVEVN